jgi:hypothetical protein
MVVVGGSIPLVPTKFNKKILYRLRLSPALQGFFLIDGLMDKNHAKH